MRTAPEALPRWASFLAVLLLALAPATPAWAQADRIGAALVLDPIIVGSLPEASQTAIRDAVDTALRELQLGLIAPADLAPVISGEPQLKDCGSELCFERLGRLLGSQLVLRYRIKVSQPAGQKHLDWHLNLELLDVDVGAFGARLTEDCKDCSTAKAQAHISNLVKSAVLQNAALPRGLLDLRTDPPGAIVFVDGTELGITPYKRSAFVGKHTLVVRHTGYRSQQLAADIEDGKKRRLELKLLAGADPVKVVVVEHEKTPVYKKWWFWVAIGGGAVAVGAVAAGIAIGTRGSGSTPMVPANTLMFP